VAVNPVTNKIYVANRDSDTVSVITEQAANPIPLITLIAPLPDRTSATAEPEFTFLTESLYTPLQPQAQQVYYQLDSWIGPWLSATLQIDGSAVSALNVSQWQATLPPQADGVHILYAFAEDGQLAGSVNPSPSYSPIPGRISAYLFLVNVPDPIYLPLIFK